MGDYGFEGAGDFGGSDYPDWVPEYVSSSRRCGGTEDAADSKSAEETRAGSIPVIAIVDYKVIDASYSLELSSKVQKAIEDGWQPFGGVSVRGDTFATSTYHQAVVKTGTIDKKV